jgi:spore germination protein GerM
MVDIRLYFMDAEYKQLVIERRPIEPAVLIPDRVKIALQALIEGPTTHRLISTIPDGTRLESVFWNEADARVYVSFSEQLLTHHPGHTLSEWGTIYAIVNTVCAQSDAIREVQILINGETIQDTNTVWDWSLPFEKDDTFVQYAMRPGE